MLTSIPVRCAPVLFAVILASCALNPNPGALQGGAYPAAPSFHPTSVSVPVEDPGTKSITASLYEPTGAGPFPAVVVLSGCAGVNADAAVVRRINVDYLPAGIAVLVVDSFTPRGITEVCSDPKLLRDIIPSRVRDAYAAVNWLRSRNEIDPKRISLQGYSHGAITAIAAVDAPRPQAQREKIAGVVAFYPYCIAGTKFTVPTMILIGEKDDWTPAKLCNDLPDKTNLVITIYPNAEHAFANPDVDMTYLGHRLLHDAAATSDGQRRALGFIQKARATASTP